ncbi:MAG TPA: hypothetical protein VEH27_00755 [Methylomirabilota bacterium]|nr:hypothetical protein [Methylomirabilota bacterium]
MKSKNQGKVIHRPGFDAMQLWWSLSRASYAVIPRAAIQAMPDKWQRKMAKLLNEMDDVALAHNYAWPPSGCSVRIHLVNNRGHFIQDPAANYRYWTPWTESASAKGEKK